MPFPSDPSPLLESMLKRLRGLSRRDPRPANPLGLKAALTQYVSLCQRHQFEVDQLPKAKARGWPTRIDFDALPSRVEECKSQLANVINDKGTSALWLEINEGIKEGGSRKVTGIAGQYLAFDKSQPG